MPNVEKVGTGRNWRAELDVQCLGMPSKKKKKKALTVQDLARMGGNARAKKLNKQQRSESSSKAAQARWHSKRGD